MFFNYVLHYCYYTVDLFFWCPAYLFLDPMTLQLQRPSFSTEINKNEFYLQRRHITECSCKVMYPIPHTHGHIWVCVCKTMYEWAFPCVFILSESSLSPHPAGSLHQLVSSLSSLMLAGNTTLEANEMQRRQSALQHLLLASDSDQTLLLTLSRSYALSAAWL